MMASGQMPLTPECILGNPVMLASNLGTAAIRLPYWDLPLPPKMPLSVTCRIQNCYDFTAHVVLLAPADNDVWLEKVIVEPGGCTAIQCPTGFLIISVFDITKDALCMCRASHVSGSFTLLLS
jgi:hypothetical protein